jgi:hypothetical protein
VLGCRPSRSDAPPLPRPLPAPPPPGLSPPLLLARGERSHPAALRAPVPRVLANPTVAVECRAAGHHVEVRLEFFLTAPRSSPLGPLQGRDPTSSTACAGTGAGRPPSPRGARGEVDPSRCHRGGAGVGAPAAAVGTRGGARPRPPPSQARGELLPTRSAHARWGARASYFGDFFMLQFVYTNVAIMFLTCCNYSPS